MNLLSFDPGERFCGYAVFWDWEILEVNVLSPDQFVQWAWQMIEGDQFDVVVGEQWRNYGDQVTWSECRTVEVLGAIRHKCLQQSVEFCTQAALIKRPGFARMRAHGVEMPDLSHIPTDDQGHARDAVVHGCWYRFEKAFPQKGLSEHFEATKPPC